jgi:hypothetical protein
MLSLKLDVVSAPPQLEEALLPTPFVFQSYYLITSNIRLLIMYLFNLRPVINATSIKVDSPQEIANNPAQFYNVR